VILGKNQLTDRTALFWVIMQRAVVIYYQRIGTTYRSHLQEITTTRCVITQKSASSTSWQKPEITPTYCL